MLFFAKIIIAALVILHADRAEATTCYKCSATTSPITDSNNCLWPTSATPTTTCAGDCYTQKYTGSVTRGCAMFCSNLFYTCDTCTTDKCNVDAPTDITKPSTNCYSCGSVAGIGSDCSSSSIQVPCAGQCSKSITTIGGVETLVKSCSPTCVAGTFNFLVKSTTYCCNGNLCNAASGVSFSIISMVIALFFALH